MTELGEKRGQMPIALVDEIGVAYGVKETNNVPHVNIEGVTVSADGELHVMQPGHISTVNSSSAALLADAVFTGVAEEITNIATILIAVYSNVGSAVDGLSVQWSIDGTNWDGSDVFTIPANTQKTFSFQPVAQYFRVVYTNGDVDQTAFRMQVILKHSYVKPSSHRINDGISTQDDAELVKAVLSGENGGGEFKNVKVTEDGNLAISNNSSGLAIAKGDVTGHSFIHKFGAAPDFDSSDGFVTVWDGAEDDEDYEAMNMTYSATADIDYAVAEDNGDTQDIEIQGLNSAYELTVQTITLTGQTPVVLTTPLIRVFRVKNMNSSDFAGHVFVYRARLGDGTPTVVTGGVPQTGADVRAVVHADNNQTEMAVFTIPAGKTGYMRSWYASTAGAKRDSSHTIKVLARPFGGVFQLKHKANIDVNGTSYIQHKYEEPEVFSEKTDIEIRMDTDTDIAGVAAGFDIVLVDN